ncbi:MAG TPA: hypothetical protein VF029_06525, partial [Actinomycetota bacterium]
MGPIPLRSAIWGGIVGGLVLAYVALVGLIERFASLRLVGEPITLGRLLLALPPFAFGYVLARPRIVAGERRTVSPSSGALAGALAGVLTSAVFGALVVSADRFGIARIRQVFIAATPGLVDVVAFGRGLAAGLTILLALGLVAGTLGGLARTGDRRATGPVAAGVTTVIVMGLLQRIVPVAMQELGIEPGFLYDPAARSL